LGQAHPRKSAFAPPTLSAARFRPGPCELLSPNFEVRPRPLNFNFPGTRLLLAQHRPNRALPGSCPWRTRPGLCRRRFSWRARPGRCLLAPYLAAAKPPPASAFGVSPHLASPFAQPCAAGAAGPPPAVLDSAGHGAPPEKPPPPGAPRRRAAPPQSIPVASRAPEHRRPGGTVPATMVDRRCPSPKFGRSRPSPSLVSTSS
jgi:hypothetical protein